MAPNRDSNGPLPNPKQRPMHEDFDYQQTTRQRQRRAVPSATRIVARCEKARDSLVILSRDTAMLARHSGQAKHAKATVHLLATISAVWLAGEALAESQEASA
jgi:hypothetical protein